MDIDDNYDNNPLKFWHKHKAKLSLLAKFANCVLMIPALSAESEHHFSIASKIVVEFHSLDPD